MKKVFLIIFIFISTVLFLIWFKLPLFKSHDDRFNPLKRVPLKEYFEIKKKMDDAYSNVQICGVAGCGDDY